MRTVESEFKITERNEDIQNMIFNISKKRKEWVQKEFKEDYDSNFQGEIKLPYLSESVSDFMVHSVSLANASHYDNKDGSLII